MKVKKDLLYTDEHEWLRVEDGKVYLGITDFAQNALGSIVFIELPEVDTEFSAGDVFGAIESVKAASDAYIPVDGKILEVNEAVVDEPELVNDDSYKNWLICFEMTDNSQLNGLMSSDQYKDFCSKEE